MTSIFLDRWTSNNQRAYFALALEGNNVYAILSVSLCSLLTICRHVAGDPQTKESELSSVTPHKILLYNVYLPQPAHNQIWLIETIDAAKDGPAPPPVPRSLPAPAEPPAPGSPTLPPGLKPNTPYKIRNPNVTSQSHLYITATWKDSMLTGYTILTGGSPTNSIEVSV